MLKSVVYPLCGPFGFMAIGRGNVATRDVMASMLAVWASWLVSKKTPSVCTPCDKGHVEADRGGCGWKNLSDTPASGTPGSGSIGKAAFGSMASRLLADAAIMDKCDGLRAVSGADDEGKDKPGRCGEEDGES